MSAVTTHLSLEMAVAESAGLWDKLPPEIKEHIVWRTIWAPQPLDPKKERWEDGPLKLELAHFHPLPHYLRQRRPQNDEITCAEKCLAALMRTSKELRRLCDRFPKELVSAHGRVDYRCDCASQETDHDGGEFATRHWDFIINQGTPSAHTKVLNVTHVEARDPDDIFYGGWPHPPPTSFEQLSQCGLLTALSLNGQTFGWMSPILDALPGGGERLEQLHFEYPDREVDPSDAELESALAAIGRCQRLRILDFEHGWEQDPPGSSQATVFSIQVATSLRHSLQQVRLSWLEGHWEGVQTLGNQTAVEAVLPLSITRLALKYVTVQASVIRTLVEACSATLEYLLLEKSSMDTDTDYGTESPPVTFKMLQVVRIDDHREGGHINPTILPGHWSLPAILTLTATEVNVSSPDDIDIFVRRLLSWTTLRYMWIRVRWGMDTSEDAAEAGRLKLARFLKDFRGKGIDATLQVR